MNPQYRFLKIGNKERTIGLIFGKIFHTTPLIISSLCQLFNEDFLKTFYINNSKKVFLLVPYDPDEYIENDQSIKDLNDRLEDMINDESKDKTERLEQLSNTYQSKEKELSEKYDNLCLTSKEMIKILKLNNYIEQDEELVFPNSTGIMIHESTYISHHCNEPYTCLALSVNEKKYNYDLIIEDSLLRELISEILDIDKEILKYNISIDDNELVIYLQEYRSYYELLSSCLENNIKTRYIFKIEENEDISRINICEDFISL